MSDIEVRRKREDALERVRRIAEEEMDLLKNGLSTPSLKVDFRCAKTRNDWTVLLSKKGNDSLFEVIRITTPSAMPQTRTGAPSVAKSTVLDISKIKNIALIKCPHCGDGGFVKCGCGQLGCQGGVRERDGKRWYVCPWCGQGGYLEGTLEKITREMQDEKRKMEPRRRPIPPRSNKALPP